jgi:lipopolysaccharide assembly protein A
VTMKHWIILAVGLLFVIFVVQNTQVVGVRFLFWKAEASRILVLLGTFAVGFVVGWLAGWPAKKLDID